MVIEFEFESEFLSVDMERLYENANNWGRFCLFIINKNRNEIQMGFKFFVTLAVLAMSATALDIGQTEQPQSLG